MAEHVHTTPAASAMRNRVRIAPATLDRRHAQLLCQPATAAQRAHIERKVEWLIGLLDALDGDPDQEDGGDAEVTPDDEGEPTDDDIPARTILRPLDMRRVSAITPVTVTVYQPVENGFAPVTGAPLAEVWARGELHHLDCPGAGTLRRLLPPSSHRLALRDPRPGRITPTDAVHTLDNIQGMDQAPPTGTSASGGQSFAAAVGAGLTVPEGVLVPERLAMEAAL